MTTHINEDALHLPDFTVVIMTTMNPDSPTLFSASVVSSFKICVQKWPQAAEL